MKQALPIAPLIAAKLAQALDLRPGNMFEPSICRFIERQLHGLSAEEVESRLRFQLGLAEAQR